MANPADITKPIVIENIIDYNTDETKFIMEIESIAMDINEGEFVALK